MGGTIYGFFDSPTGTYGNALLNWTSKPLHELTGYAHSYRMAAMNLVAMRERREIGTIDEGALPILFMYRHSFELYLKSIVMKAAVLTINEEELHLALPRLWREHGLATLVRMAEPIISTNTKWPLTRNGDLKEFISELAKKIDEVDPGSYSFRYPVDVRGSSPLPPVFLTNIFRFSEEVERTLDCIVQFCRVLDEERIQGSAQMKLALHGLLVKERKKT